MSLREKQRAEAKLDSRRFGKSVVTRIVHGPLLSLMEQKGLIPRTILINNETGVDPINNKMVVIPVSKYSQIIDLMQQYDNTITEASNGQDDLESFEKIQRSNESLLTAIKQNMILITISSVKPEGKLAGLDPNVYDVLIDSVDVNQAIEGTYVYRNIANLRTVSKWNR